MDFIITGQNREWERSRSSPFRSRFKPVLGLRDYGLSVRVSPPTFHHHVYYTYGLWGTVLGLQWLGINLSVVVFLGLIMLAGIVVNVRSFLSTTPTR